MMLLLPSTGNSLIVAVASHDQYEVFSSIEEDCKNTPSALVVSDVCCLQTLTLHNSLFKVIGLDSMQRPSIGAIFAVKRKIESRQFVWSLFSALQYWNDTKFVVSTVDWSSPMKRALLPKTMAVKERKTFRLVKSHFDRVYL